MTGENQHHEIEQCTVQVQQAYQLIEQAKSANGDMEQLMQAEQQLLQAEQHLKATQHQFGNAALENAQFQQTEEQLHDARQQIDTIKQQNK
ncbi:hypothetical protein ACFQ4N_15790 [Oceanobacillus iheyensis]|uniref:hypothetical protein n=1 Tax=Oceanobacillus iheyensis TaxID=182710 RepID=UPI0036311E04